MSAAATRLVPRVVGIEIGFSVGSAALVGLLSPYFLLLNGPVAAQGAGALALGVATGGVAGSLYAALRLLRYRYVLRALAVGSQGVEPRELLSLSAEPKAVLAGWLTPSAAGVATFTVGLRPPILDLTTGITLCLLGSVITAAASLPLFALVRAAFSAALELAPHEVMREVVEDAEREGAIGQHVSRRMLAAVTTPVVVLALGSALIVSAHVRRADERDREETARVFARAALDAGPAPSPLAGLDLALERGKALGFSARHNEGSTGYVVTRADDGVASLRAPLDSGSAQVRFSGSTVGFLGIPSVVVTLLALLLAGSLGNRLGTSLALDLRSATRNVRELGTDVVVSGLTSGTRILRAARFQVIAKLGSAIEHLAQRFRVFAKAQERAIEARKAAARMRGLFFASVSHDLKSPLNAILGFTELVRKHEPLSAGQAESLNFIEHRGRELLALIETILDAARVEAGQLKLVVDEMDVPSLLNDATQKGRELAAEFERPVVIEAAPDMPRLRVDHVRMPRAIATLVAHALRTSEAPTVRVSASVQDGYLVRIDVELVSSGFNAVRLESMLDPNRDPGAGEHRGLALGLRLSRSVTELHGGKLLVSARGNAGALSVLLPFRAVPRKQPPPTKSRPRASWPPGSS
ncbi:MAG: HAMP domain-containing sensor histidine kinase [Polyangiaceae bacterium]